MYLTCAALLHHCSCTAASMSCHASPWILPAVNSIGVLSMLTWTILRRYWTLKWPVPKNAVNQHIVHLHNCKALYSTQPALTQRPVQIHPELMPDALHPNAAGMELFAQCLSPLVDELMTSSMTLHERSMWRG